MAFEPPADITIILSSCIPYSWVGDSGCAEAGGGGCAGASGAGCVAAGGGGCTAAGVDHAWPGGSVGARDVVGVRVGAGAGAWVAGSFRSNKL